MKFNKITKHLLALFVFIFLNASLNAQNKKNFHEKMRAYKVAYITDQLNFSELNAQKFWPIYNDYTDQMTKLHKEERYKIKKRIDKLGGTKNLSETEAKEILKHIIDIEKNRSELKTVFFNNISKFLSYKKIVMLELAEHEFNRKLLRKLKGSKNFKH